MHISKDKYRMLWELMGFRTCYPQILHLEHWTLEEFEKVAEAGSSLWPSPALTLLP